MPIKYDPAAELCIVAYDNTDFSLPLQYEGIDITGYTFEMKVRDSADLLILTPTITITDAANGNFTLSALETAMELITPGAYVYDVRYMTTTSGWTPLIKGSFTIVKGVTNG